MTPERRLPRILKEGLKVSTRKVMSASWEPSKGRIYLGSRPEECWKQLDISGPYVDVVSNWALLAVSLPQGHPVYEDDEGYLYTTKNIPPNYLRVYHRDTETRRREKKVMMLKPALMMPPEIRARGEARRKVIQTLLEQKEL